jgi:hypothetical protein
LRALAEVSMPTRQEAERIAEALRAAVSTVSEHSDRAMELVETRNALLAQAVDLHAKHGDMTCPVCGKRGLDDSWHARAVRAEATALLAEREDARAPSAQQLAKWTELKQRAQAQADVTRTVQAAANWLRNNVTALRNKQLEPLADGARAIWGMLRQESNVGLGTIALTGQNTNSRVELRADVDCIARMEESRNPHLAIEALRTGCEPAPDR